MTITIARVGTGDVDSGGGGTNSTASFTSASTTWAVDDWVLVGCWVYNDSGNDWTLSTTVTPSGGAVAAATVIASPATTVVYPGYEGRCIFLAARVTTGFTGTMTVTRTPSGSADHWSTCNFYRLDADGTITFPLSDDAVGTGDTTTTVTPDLGTTPAASSALFAVFGGDSGNYGTLLDPLTYPSGWTHHDERDTTAWSNGATCLSTGYKVGSGTQTNAVTAANGLSNGFGALVALVVEIAEAGAAATSRAVRRRSSGLSLR